MFCLLPILEKMLLPRLLFFVDLRVGDTFLKLNVLVPFDKVGVIGPVDMGPRLASPYLSFGVNRLRTFEFTAVIDLSAY